MGHKSYLEVCWRKYLKKRLVGHFSGSGFTDNDFIIRKQNDLRVSYCVKCAQKNYKIFMLVYFGVASRQGENSGEIFSASGNCQGKWIYDREFCHDKLICSKND